METNQEKANVWLQILGNIAIDTKGIKQGMKWQIQPRSRIFKYETFTKFKRDKTKTSLKITWTDVNKSLFKPFSIQLQTIASYINWDKRVNIKPLIANEVKKLILMTKKQPKIYQKNIKDIQTINEHFFRLLLGLDRGLRRKSKHQTGALLVNFKRHR